MTQPSMYNDLIEACAQSGCPLCRLEAQTVERYLKMIFYENVNDIQERGRLRASLGFCHEHACLELESGLADPLGVSIIYQDVITNILRRLSDPAQPGRRSGLLKRLPSMLHALTPHKPCPVCQQKEIEAHLALTTLVKHLDEKLLQALADGDGLCLPHLCLALENLRDAEAQTALLALSRQKLEQLNHQLAEFIRKNDYRFHDEGFGSEADSWKRAIHKIHGE